MGQTGCGKAHLVSDLIKKEYKKYFDYIIAICSMLRINKTYHAKDWIKNDNKVWLIEPTDNLYQWIGKLLQLLSHFKTLFINDDTTANKDLGKRRQPLLELSISGRHQGHYLWLLVQSYLAIPKRKQGAGHSYFCLVPKRKGRSQDYT